MSASSLSGVGDWGFVAVNSGPWRHRNSELGAGGVGLGRGMLAAEAVAWMVIYSLEREEGVRTITAPQSRSTSGFAAPGPSLGRGYLVSEGSVEGSRLCGKTLMLSLM